MESVIEVYLTPPAAGGSYSLFRLVWEADLIVQLVLLGLVFMSLICWAIILQKFFRLGSAARQSAKFLDVFWASKRLDAVYEKAGKYRPMSISKSTFC